MAGTNQTDVVAENAKLTGEVAALRTQLEAANSKLGSLTVELTTARGERDTAVTALGTANDQVRSKDATIATLTGEKTALAGQVSTLTASQSDFEAKVAAECAKHGINPKAVTQPKAGTETQAAPGATVNKDGIKTKNYTEICQAHVAEHGKTPIAAK
jgi:chromosome segregation ATPase